jgi:hypothetical protein
LTLSVNAGDAAAELARAGKLAANFRAFAEREHRGVALPVALRAYALVCFAQGRERRALSKLAKARRRAMAVDTMPFEVNLDMFLLDVLRKHREANKAAAAAAAAAAGRGGGGVGSEDGGGGGGGGGGGAGEDESPHVFSSFQETMQETIRDAAAAGGGAATWDPFTRFGCAEGFEERLVQTLYEWGVLKDWKPASTSPTSGDASPTAGHGLGERAAAAFTALVGARPQPITTLAGGGGELSSTTTTSNTTTTNTTPRTRRWRTIKLRLKGLMFWKR